MLEPSGRKIELLGQSIEFDLRRSQDASDPRIDVDIHGVTIVLPADSELDPEQLLIDNTNWVVARKERYDKHRDRIPEREFEPGAEFPYLGEMYEIRVRPGSRSEITDESLDLAKHNVEQTSIRRVLETLYRRKARDWFTDRADQYSLEMGVEYDTIELRNQRTRWGSCSTTGTLSLNWRLMMAPPDIIDYIIIHELTHLREPTHNDAFWNLVVKHDPDYATHAEWLDKRSTWLIFSEEDL